MVLSVLIIIIAVAGLVFLILSVTDKNKSGKIQFFAKGKDSGFSLKEIELLHRLAVKSKLEDPSTLFFSLTQLDTCIKALVKSMHSMGTEDDKENHDFLSKLYDFRKKIEMEKPKVKHGITNSRQISEGQNLRILLKGIGVLKSQIVRNTSNNLTISRPTSGKLPAIFSWQGVEMSIYFWRNEDAGYVFDTHVMDEVFSKGIASLKVEHTDSLFRTQKRKSVRVKMHKAAYLYPVTNEDELNRIEINPGAKCFVEDLSDTGCAVTIGGKGKTGLRIKVQFALNNSPVCMSGTVRSVDFKGDLNRSVLHIEADHLPLETRNKILGEVFGMLPDDEEELPFRLLDEEVEAMVLEEDDEENPMEEYLPEESDNQDAAS